LPRVAIVVKGAVVLVLHNHAILRPGSVSSAISIDIAQPL
jgi:hypothetical protein